jgi:hypothetical protein
MTELEKAKLVEKVFAGEVTCIWCQRVLPVELTELNSGGLRVCRLASECHKAWLRLQPPVSVLIYDRA